MIFNLQRGQLYRVKKAGGSDPKNYRVVVIVSRAAVLINEFSSVICAPIYTRFDGLRSQVTVSIPEGLKHESAIFCDNLLSLPKVMLTDYVGSLSPNKLRELDLALCVALDIGSP